MDNQIPTVPNSPVTPLPLGKNSTRRILFIVLGVVVLAEVIWAGSMLMKPVEIPAPRVQSQPVEMEEKETTISLTTSATGLKVGGSIDVAIDMSSSKKTNGSDIIINFDPKKLTVQNPDAPVVKGSIYSSYPVNRVDAKLGKITVSGISESGAVMADGLFGVITFKAKVPGPTTISIEFSPGSTTDTNVIDSESGEDVLEKVQNLEINIQ